MQLLCLLTLIIGICLKNISCLEGKQYSISHVVIYAIVNICTFFGIFFTSIFKLQFEYIVKYMDTDYLFLQLHVSAIILQLIKFIKHLSSLTVASYLYSKKPNDSDCNHIIDELNEFYVPKTILKLSNPNLLAISRWNIKSIYCCLCIKSEKIIKDDFSHG